MMSNRFAILLIAAITLSFSACSTTKQAKKTEESGFLVDYSQLKTGGSEQSLLVYLNPSASWSIYNKVILDPVRVYASPDSNVGDMSKEDLQSIVDYFDASVRQSLGGYYTFVKDADENTMRLRIALTDAKGSKRVLDTMSTVLPPAIAISSLKNVFTGSTTGVGKACVEAEILDSLTGERLMAAVDARVGGKSFDGKFDKWDDVKKAIDYWAERLATRLTEEREKGTKP